MKKLFITVGTTSFDSLIKYIDKNVQPNFTDYKFIYQLANGLYIPKNGDSFDFSDEISTYYFESDVIICHAGAGTIYQLLEMGKSIITVPNLERIDKHQSDIARNMAKSNFLVCCEEFENLSDSLKDITSRSLEAYVKEPFFKSTEIIEYLTE